MISPGSRIVLKRRPLTGHGEVVKYVVGRSDQVMVRLDDGRIAFPLVRDVMPEEPQHLAS